jgi:acetyl esterase/lipase
MSATLSPRERIEAAVFRRAAALPASAQRLLGGPGRVQVDGQVLDPEAQLLLRLLRLFDRPALDTLPVSEAREDRRRAGAAVSGTPLPVASVEDRSLPGPAGELDARLYVPHGAPTPGALLVYLHGGGWVVCDLGTHDQVCRFIAREARMRVLSVDYRLAPEHPFPAAVDDAVAAVRFAISAAGSLGADPARVGVGGDSAGGNLAAAASLLLAADGPGPAFQLLIYPVTDLSRKRRSYELFRDGFFLTEREMDWFRDQYLQTPGAALDPRASPLLAESLAGLPPAHVALAGFDVLRDEGEEYALRLAEAGVPVTVSRHIGLIHGFCNMCAAGRASRPAMHEVAAALRRLAGEEPRQ